ncbi:hypothetical protein SSX86_022068 [Deinandra increscens subsp. villosa]|uniref:Uncharacterized protein n=1 Tax=Deinandra increscens subsp. villosa TaxID=3103831 RepID=A0AAP0CPV9_9ASTR
MKGKLGYSWRRRGGYRRLDEVVRSKEEGRGKWSWKIRMPRKMKLRRLKFIISLKKVIGRVHDAYVRMMIRVANSPVVIRGGGVIGGYGGGVEGQQLQFGMRPMKEYDEKMIIQMYNSLVIRRQLKAAALDDPPQPPPQVSAGRPVRYYN